MGILNIFNKKKTGLNIKSYDSWLTGFDYDTREYSSERAFRNNPVVFQCIRILCKKVLSIPLKIYKEVGGKAIEVPDTEIEIFVKPNEYQSFSDLIKMMISWKDLWGTAYLYVIRDNNKRPVKIYALRSSLITPIYDENSLYKNFLYNVGGKSISLSPEDVIVWKNDNPFSDREGVSVIEVIKENLLEKDLLNTLNRGLLNNASRPPGVLYTEQSLTTEEINNILTTWNAAHSKENFGKIALLTGGLKYQEVGLKLQDAMFLEQVKLNKRDVAAAFGVPPMFLGDYDFANYKVEEQRKNFYLDTVIPLCKDIENLFNSSLMYWYGKEYWCEFDLSSIPELQEDLNKKSEIEERYVKNGIMTINEIRKEKGLEPVSWGDDWWIPISNVPVGYNNNPKGENLDNNKNIILNTENNNPQTEEKLSNGFYKDMYWKVWELSLRPQERRLIKVINKYFTEQKKRILKRLNSLKTFKKDWDFIFNMTEEVEEFIKSVLPYLIGFMKSAAENQVELWDLEMDWEAFDTYAREYLGRTLPKVSGLINETTFNKIKEILNEGFDEGWSIDKIAKEISSQFEEFSRIRAETIARTEIIGSNNEAAYITYKMNGVKRIRWLTARDERVRRTHNLLDGVVVNIGEEFVTINGDKLLYPGDHNGPAKEVINCRCTITPEI